MARKDRTRPPADPGPSRTFTAYLLLTALVCGALVMVIQVLGSRVVGPFFGVSLFVWTSLITVTLLALATGYAIGGLAADRRSTPDMLYWIILGAGVLSLLVPVLRGPVLKASVPLGLRSGAFVGTLLLFGPVLFLLGCVSPYLVKIATRHMRHLGTTVGGLYAVSTAGSVAGTVLTGFVLIAYVGVDRIFQLVGIVLLLLGTGYFLVFRKRAGVALTLLLPVVVPHPAGFTSTTMESGTRVTLVAAADSFYGSVRVLDYSYAGRRVRDLLIDGLVQGGVDPSSGLSVHAYPYLAQLVPRLLNPGGETCLVLGLGAGIVPRWYRAQGVATDVVDIDPVVVSFARRYFGFDGDVIVADARRFAATVGKEYAYVILDVHNGDIMPAHLLSAEALQVLRRRLSPGGVLAVNLVGSLQREAYMTRSVLRTLGAVFDQVEIYPAFDVHGPTDLGNMIVAAYLGPPRPRALDGVVQTPIHPAARETVMASLRAPVRPGVVADGLVLSDDYNPIDFFDAWLREYVRRFILDHTPWDALLAAGRQGG